MSLKVEPRPNRSRIGRGKPCDACLTSFAPVRVMRTSWPDSRKKHPRPGHAPRRFYAAPAVIGRNPLLGLVEQQQRVVLDYVQEGVLHVVVAESRDQCFDGLLFGLLERLEGVEHQPDVLLRLPVHASGQPPDGALERVEEFISVVVETDGP